MITVASVATSKPVIFVKSDGEEAVRATGGRKLLTRKGNGGDGGGGLGTLDKEDLEGIDAGVCDDTESA
ncbi:MAG: hypothetical protein HQM15_10700 [Deltaproteobacteria bacterium]|nr:hypothetical protein [Deltaproteobacteria bacterium]